MSILARPLGELFICVFAGNANRSHMTDFPRSPDPLSKKNVRRN